MVLDIARWALTAVVLLAAVIGVLFITRGTALRRVRGMDADGTTAAPEEPGFTTMLGLLTGSTLVAGNRIELALNGDGTYERLWADLRAARLSITVQMYYAQPGQVADQLREILAERARAGVRVAFLFDAFGASALPRAYIASLRRAGVRMVPFRPLRFRNLWVVQNRSHVRGIVVDGRIGWTGGFGIDDKWLGDGRTGLAWRESNVRFEGPAVHQLMAAFVAAWAEATGELLSGTITAGTPVEGVAPAGLLATAPTLGSTPAERFLALSIAGALRRLYVTNAYFAPDRNFTRLLAAAARRGVDVQILVGGPRTDVRTARLAARSRYEKLLVAGVRMFEYQPSTLHAKTFVADGVWSSVGTMNFDNRSLALNDEVTLMVLDRGFGAEMERVFFDDLRYAEEVELASFRRRPRLVRVAEQGANLIASLL
ncbi:MAG: phospholipase D-like domain-containing protein [Gemmatimonadaceae bacterium]